MLNELRGVPSAIFLWFFVGFEFSRDKDVSFKPLDNIWAVETGSHLHYLSLFVEDNSPYFTC